MSVEFSAHSRIAGQFLPSDMDERINMNGASAGRVAGALGIDEVWNGGSESLDEFERRIFRNADGHPDEYVAMRLLQLAALVRDARRKLPSDARITWG